MLMVDIHHHLVYGVDDGARTWEDMQAMLTVAHDNQVRDVVATSHATPGRHRFPADLYLEHLQKGQEWIDQQGWDMRLHSGCEIFYTDEAPRLVDEGYIPTLDETWNVLVEFGLDVSFERLCDAARQFGNRGYTMVLAHFERYNTLRSLDQVRRLRDEYRVLMQMNTNTITVKHGFFNDRWVKKMLEGEYVDMVATDAHNIANRKCNMLECYELLKEQYGPVYANKLCGGMQREILQL